MKKRAIITVEHIQDQHVRRVLEGMRDAIEQLNGARSIGNERAATVDELIEAGVIVDDRGTIAKVKEEVSDNQEGFTQWLEDGEAAGAAVPQVVLETSSFTVLSGQSGTCFANVGAGGVITATLPVAVAPLQYIFVRDNSGNKFRIDPDGTETIGTGGGGKYIELDTDHATVTIKAVTAGGWEIIASNGTLVFQP